MPSRKRNAAILRALCAQLHPDDGVDPRELKRRGAMRIYDSERKLLQLCKQVAHALQLVLPNVLTESSAVVTHVAPAPNAGRLCVFVSVSHDEDPRELEARLKRSSGYLRSEIALAVSRRRVPELTFSIVVEAEPKD